MLYTVHGMYIMVHYGVVHKANMKGGCSTVHGCTLLKRHFNTTLESVAACAGLFPSPLQCSSVGLQHRGIVRLLDAFSPHVGMCYTGMHCMIRHEGFLILTGN